MKKMIILICTLCSTSLLFAMAEEVQPKMMICPPITKEDMIKMRKAREAAFEQKLGLTEAQKIKAHELRKQGYEKMHPIMEQLKSKHQEARMVKMSRIAVQEQEARLAVIDKEIKELEKQASAIRKQNMKDFETILTAEQKKILKNMKKEGRQNFDKSHKHHSRPPFIQ